MFREKIDMLHQIRQLKSFIGKSSNLTIVHIYTLIYSMPTITCCVQLSS